MKAPVLSAALIAISALAASALLTQLVHRIAARSGVLDIPNPRSSHGVPTPRGGGVAIVLVTTAGTLVLAMFGMIRRDMAYALGGGLAVALIGFIDDRRSLSASTRLAVHFIAALWALVWLGGLPPLQLGTHVIALGWFGYLLGAFGIVWVLNLFNFMDGIDGLAASEAIFISVAGAVLTAPLATGTDVDFAALVFAAACGGFLVWNWPPARIFLGDVGSGYLGYAVVIFALSAGRDNPVALWIWLILGGAFFADATVTLLRRLLRGERVYQAHRSHAYQWLARRWGSHRPATVAFLAVNFLWLLPWAMLATRFPSYAALSVAAALAPLALLATVLRAGKGERRDGGAA